MKCFCFYLLKSFLIVYFFNVIINYIVKLIILSLVFIYIFTNTRAFMAVLQHKTYQKVGKNRFLILRKRTTPKYKLCGQHQNYDTKGARRLYTFKYKMLSKIHTFSLICFYDTFPICISYPMSYFYVFVIKNYTWFIDDLFYAFYTREYI